MAQSAGFWLDINTDLSPLRSSRVDKKSSEACGMSMGSQGWNNYHPLRKYWQPLPCSLSSSISFSVHRYRFFAPPKNRGRSPYYGPPPPLPHRVAPGADRATGCGFVVTAQRPPAGCIHPQRSNRRTVPFMVNAGGQQRSRQPGNAEGSRYQHDGGDAAFLPGCAVDVKFCSPRSATAPGAALPLS